MRMAWSGAVLAVVLAAAAAQARDLAGVKMDDTMAVGGATLKLNGMALRSKKVAFVSVKVYVGGLYLAAPATTADAALAADAPRAMVMEFVRDVDRGKLVDGWKDGFAANSPDKQAAQKANIDKFLAAVTDVKDGQRVIYVYEPGKGTTVTFPGGKSFTAEGKDFADVFLANYIGKDPPSADFKAGLLKGG